MNGQQFRTWPTRGRWERETFVLALNVVGFAVASWGVARLFSGAHLAGSDGEYHRLNAVLQPEYASRGLSFSANPLQGIGGNIWFPYNSSLDPGLLIARLMPSAGLLVLITTWCLLLWAATYLLARAVHLSRGTALVAAWSTGLLISWPSAFAFDNGLLRLSTTAIPGMALTTLMMAFVLFRPLSARWWLPRTGALFLSGIVLTAYQPDSLPLLLVPLAGVGIAVVAVQRSVRDAALAVSAPGVAGLLLAITGPGVFIMGLFGNTSSRFFAAEMAPNAARGFPFVSGFFGSAGFPHSFSGSYQFPSGPYSWAWWLAALPVGLMLATVVWWLLRGIRGGGVRALAVMAAVVVGLYGVMAAFQGAFIGYSAVSMVVCLTGCLLLVGRPGSDSSAMALGVAGLVGTALVAVLSGLQLLTPEVYSVLPAPVYFEWAVWPLLCVGGGAASVAAAHGLQRVPLRGGSVTARRGGFGVLIAAGAGVVLLAVLGPVVRPVLFGRFVMPPSPGGVLPHGASAGLLEGSDSRSDRTLRILSGSALSHDRPFAGRYMMVFPSRFPDCCPGWTGDTRRAELTAMEAMVYWNYPSAVFRGVDLNAIAPWAHRIPTLYEYSPHITPYAHLFLKGMEREGDRQNRSVMLLRDPDASLMALIGVRWLLTDAVLAGFGPVRQVLEGSLGDDPPLRLYLYEVPDANTQGWSPTRAMVVPDVREAVARVTYGRLDLRREALVDRAIPFAKERGDLVAATATRLDIARDGYTVAATSGGSSLLVLPIEYSRCWAWRSKPGQPGVPQTVRVNGILLGLAFSGRVEGHLSYRTGPYTRPGCRLADARDFPVSRGGP